jgi:hypothetical protein
MAVGSAQGENLGLTTETHLKPQEQNHLSVPNLLNIYGCVSYAYEQ